MGIMRFAEVIYGGLSPKNDYKLEVSNLRIQTEGFDARYHPYPPDAREPPEPAAFRASKCVEKM